MLVERSELIIKEGAAEEFQSMMRAEGLPLLRAVAGANVVQFGRGVENPRKFILLIEWEAMDAHTAFTQHVSFPKFIELLTPYNESGVMEHFVME